MIAYCQSNVRSHSQCNCVQGASQISTKKSKAPRLWTVNLNYGPSDSGLKWLLTVEFIDADALAKISVFLRLDGLYR